MLDFAPFKICQLSQFFLWEYIAQMILTNNLLFKHLQ